MEIIKLINGMLGENCYVVYNTNSCIVIDPGRAYKDVIKFIEEKNLTILGVLLTHGHFDHIWDSHLFQKDGVNIYIHKLDSDKCEDNIKNLSGYMSGLITFKPDVLLKGKEINFNIGDFFIKMLHTPGHSKGGVTYIIDKYLFTGDTMFQNTYGRTDFYDGNIDEMFKSLDLLEMYVKDGYILCPGH